MIKHCAAMEIEMELAKYLPIRLIFLMIGLKTGFQINIPATARYDNWAPALNTVYGSIRQWMIAVLVKTSSPGVPRRPILANSNREIIPADRRADGLNPVTPA